MLKITVSINKQKSTLSFSVGQTFPEVQGKLLSVEASGKELTRLLEKREIPVVFGDNTSVTWHGAPAGRALRDLRELFAEKA